MACLYSAGTNTKKQLLAENVFLHTCMDFVPVILSIHFGNQSEIGSANFLEWVSFHKSSLEIQKTSNYLLIFFYFCRIIWMSQLLLHWLHSFWYFLYRSKCLIFLVSHFFQVLHYLSWFTFCYFLLVNTIIEMLREQTTHRMKIGWNYRHKRNYWKPFRKFSRRKRQRLLVQKNQTKVDIAFFSRFVFFFVWCYQLSFEQRITRNSMAWIWPIA